MSQKALIQRISKSIIKITKDPFTGGKLKAVVEYKAGKNQAMVKKLSCKHKNYFFSKFLEIKKIILS